MRFLVKLLLAGGILTCVSCNKNDIEDDDWCLDPKYLVPLDVVVNLQDSLHDHCVIDTIFENRPDSLDTRAMAFSATGLKLRYYAAAYAQDNDILPLIVRSSWTNVVPIDLHPGKYNIVSWVNYESEESRSGLNFHTDDFNELLLKNKYNYFGATRYKMGYRASEFHSIPYNAKSISVTAKPAMGMYRLIPTDSLTYTPEKILVKYRSLLPSSINVLTGTINWWWDDISYTAAYDGEELASDFVFSQDTEETQVTVTVEVYDDAGLLRARKKNLEIPLINGGVTTVKGNFFTILELDPLEDPGHSSGISINTEWDATFEIEI